MRVYKDEEMRWSMLRYDSRTFTAQQAAKAKHLEQLRLEAGLTDDEDIPFD